MMSAIVNLRRNRSDDLAVDDAGEGATLELGVLNDLLGYQLRRVQSRVFQRITKQLEAEGLTAGQMGLLIKIQHNAGVSQTALAKANGIERSTLGEIVERFEKRKWIVRKRHPSDGRAYALSLSAEGSALLDRIVPRVVAEEASLTAALSDSERETLLALLAKLAN